MTKPVKAISYKQAYNKCLDIASKHFETASEYNTPEMKLRAEEAWSIYQSQGALMERLPLKKSRMRRRG